MTKTHELGPLALSVVCLKLLAPRATDGKLVQVGWGSGFFWAQEGWAHPWLVTNWHVLTQKDPDNRSHFLPGQTVCPTHFSVLLCNRNNLLQAKEQIFPLYQNSVPSWIEPPESVGANIAAFPTVLSDDVAYLCVNKIAPKIDTPIEAGLTVVTVGFAFEQSEEFPFPIYKGGIVASEPAVRVNGKRQTLIDSSGVPGMSGSPVLRSRVALRPTGVGSEVLEAAAEKRPIDPKRLARRRFDETVTFDIIGIYAGAVGEQNARLRALSLGRFFPVHFIEQVFAAPRPGSTT